MLRCPVSAISARPPTGAGGKPQRGRGRATGAVPYVRVLRATQLNWGMVPLSLECNRAQYT